MDRVDPPVELLGRDVVVAGQDPGQVRRDPGAEREAAPDQVLPQPALGLVHAEGDRAAERAAGEARRDLRLVEPVAELVQRAEVRAREVVQVVAGGDAHVAAAERLGERVRRHVEAPAVGVEADALEHHHARAPLGLHVDLAAERQHERARRLRDERHERLAQLREQRPQLRRGHLRLEVVEQHVVGVLVAREAAHVLVAELQVPGHRVAEAAVVGGGARRLPRRLAERRGAAHLRRQPRRHPHGLLDVAPHLGDQADVVGVRVLAGRPRLEHVEQPRQLRVGQPLVVDGLQRRRLIAARHGAARGHHRVLVPEQQRADAVEVVEDRRALPQRDELGGDGAHRAGPSGRAARRSAVRREAALRGARARPAARRACRAARARRAPRRARAVLDLRGDLPQALVHALVVHPLRG